MVFFACDACGQSLKKNQVEKHLRGCRKFQFMSCIDCNQEFWGEDYKAHIKCISEDEKYGGKNYKPKTSSNKGENKQNDWMELIREVISTSNVKPHLVHVMQEIVQQPNLPRKQAKFEKFLQNSLRHKNPEILKEAWNIFSKAQVKIKLQKDESNQQVVSANEAKENSKITKDEVGGEMENTITEEPKLNNSQSKKRKGKYEENEIETSGHQKKKKQRNTEILETPEYQENAENGIEISSNSNMEEEIKRKKSHKKKSKSKQLGLDNLNVVSDIPESFEVSNCSIVLKKKNKKCKIDKEEIDDNAIETTNIDPDITESIEVPDTSVVTKKKNKKRKRDKKESEANAIETSKEVSDITESIEVPISAAVIKKKTKKHKRDKEESEANGIETSKHLKFEIPEQDILKVKDNQVDVSVSKKKKKKCKTG